MEKVIEEEVVEAGAEPIPPQPSPEDPESLKKMLAEAQERVTRAEQDATISKQTADQLRATLSGQERKLQKLLRGDERLERLEAHVLDLRDALSGQLGEESIPTSPRVTALESRRKGQWETDIRQTQEKIDLLLEHSEVPQAALQADEEFKTLLSQGDLEGVLSRAKSFIKSYKPSSTVLPKETETEEEKVERRAQELLRQQLEKRGLLKSEVGTGGSQTRTGPFSRKEIADPAFWKTNKEAILEAQKRGQITE